MCIAQSHKFTIRHFRPLIQTREEKSCIEKDTFQQSNRFSPSSVAFRQTIHPSLISNTTIYKNSRSMVIMCKTKQSSNTMTVYTFRKRKHSSKMSLLNITLRFGDVRND